MGSTVNSVVLVYLESNVIRCQAVVFVSLVGLVSGVTKVCRSVCECITYYLHFYLCSNFVS